ncbi:hypothetical protein B0H15DRAFT_614521 [Mycena belliarum]|uniref:MYND-type domain-containing protein n=1 Tax=Mycena belliarum TaxID=1033014 RepID=A0AAD6TPT6_9AGAR|nr:hypothetical protein B0H15DRAFT_614521 [Mycena belliae]
MLHLELQTYDNVPSLPNGDIDSLCFDTMNPQEFALHRAAILKYDPLNPPGSSSQQLRAHFVSRLQTFARPCGTIASIWEPLSALESLTATLTSVPRDLARIARRPEPIHDAWSDVFDARIADNSLQDVWRWLQFLHALCAADSQCAPADWKLSWAAQTLTWQAVVYFLFACLQLQGYSICYWFNNAGALGMIGNVWYLQAEHYAPLPGTPIAQILHFALLCWSRDMYDTKGQEPIRAQYGQRLIEETGRTVEELSFAILAHLVRDTAQDSRETMVYNLAVLLLLSRHEPISKSLMARHSLHIAIRALHRIVRPRLTIRDDLSDNVVTSSCSYLLNCLNTGDGASCVIRSLEAGLLTSLLAGFRPTHHEHYHILHSTLPPYLVYLSVVRPAAKALKKVQKLGLEGRMDRRGPLFDSWSIFKRVLEQRIELAGDKAHLVCASKKCNRVDFTDDDLRYCVGCMLCAYCSRECQTSDWKAGHSKYCKNTRASRNAGTKVKLASEDLSFAQQVLEKDRILRSLEVMQIMHKTRELAIEFDYTEFPMKVRPMKALEAKTSYTLIQLTLPPGRQPHKLHVKYAMPKELAESVTSRGVY